MKQGQIVRILQSVEEYTVVTPHCNAVTTCDPIECEVRDVVRDLCVAWTRHSINIGKVSE